MTPIRHWALAYEADCGKVGVTMADALHGKPVPVDNFLDHVFTEGDGRFDSLDAVLDAVRTRLWERLGTGDGPKDGDKLILRIEHENVPLSLYYTLAFEEIHDFEIRVIGNERQLLTPQPTVGK